MEKKFRYLPNIPPKIIFFAVAAMVAVHLVLLATDTYQRSSSQHIARIDAAVQKVINVIHMVEATPINQVRQAIRAVDDPTVRVTITNKRAVWHHHFESVSFWKLNSVLRKQANERNRIEISLQMSNGAWLNIRTRISSNPWGQQLFLLVLEAIIIFTVLFYAWAINRFSTPLKRFRHAAEQLGVDVHSKPLDESYNGPRIVRETALTMNRLQKRISDLISDRNNMLGAISHDLRTPITRLKLRAHKIKEKELQDKMIHDLDEMEIMISELMAFARDDASSESKNKVDLNSLLQSLCDDMADMKMPVNYKSDGKRIPYNGRALALKRAFTNLIENAVKYGKEARVELRKKGSKILVIIDDDGPGIPEDQLEQVFNPFYRLDGSRSRDIAGTGLGLAVVRDAVRAHLGDILLKNRPKGGLRVIVTLFLK